MISIRKHHEVNIKLVTRWIT